MIPAMVATAAPSGVAAERAALDIPIERLERWLLRGGAFLLPLAYTWNSYDGYILPKLLLARILVCGLAALWLVRAALAGRAAIRRTALDLPILAFVLSAAISTVFAFNPNVAVFGTYSRYDGLLTTVTYAALFWLAVQTLRTRDEARGILRVMLAAGYSVAAVAIVQSLRDSIEAGQLLPAFGTLGQKNALGMFLVLLLPAAYTELATARTWTARILALNALTLMTVALLLSFSRSAWIAGAGAVLITVIAVHRGRRLRVAVLAATALVVVAGAAFILASGLLVQRTDLLQLGDRPVVWSDTLRLIASRPLVGYGPDNFGLVFPSFESTHLQQPWDKAHSEVLQIAATQGLLGVVAYAWFLAAFAWAFWKGPRDAIAWGVLAGWACYQAELQVNFTMLAAAFPFWIVTAAAMVTFGGTRDVRTFAFGARNRWLGAAGVVAVFGMVSALPAYLADVDLRSAVIADFSGQQGAALAPATEAMRQNPFDSVYATEVGNLAFERGDWGGARTAYRVAAALGTFNDAVYRNLALADQHLGLFDEGRDAAQRAYELNRFDPANRALFAQFGGKS